MGDSPVFRAVWAKYTVGSIKRAPADIREPLLAALSSSLRDEIRRATSLDWQDARVFMDLCHCIAGCGDDLARAFWRYSLNQSIGQPLIAPLVRGGLSLFGRGPVALYQRTPRAWSLVSRACGDMSAVDGDHANALVLVVENLPPVCRQHEGLLRLWEGGFCGQADFVSETAKVVTRSDLFASEGRAEFLISW